MKAIVVNELGGPDVLQLSEVAIPAILPHQVLIRTEAISVNFADIKARRGEYHGKVSASPFIPGLDCAGEIIKVGAQVTRFKIGQRVMAFPKEGSYAEYVAADEKLAFAVPDGLDSETAAASLTVGITAYNVLNRVARLSPGETVLIHAAAGGIGTTAIQLARLAGASQVIGTVSSEAKMETAKNMGADHVINYATGDFAEKVNSLTDGQGADVILDTVAGENFEKSLRCLAHFGRIVAFGHGNDRSLPGKVTTADLHSSCRSVLGYSTGTYRKLRPDFLQESADKVTDLLLQAKLKILISKRYPLAEAAQAHSHIESRKSIGKILLIP
ncbi:NADPH:quinone oxidoreductase family protein [Planomicrobium sp. CPCC 101079]|uniref:quinone oxidoreductase family protein n=1 Tax=Planomicrobium sp. CPCC 101079 TaxID=2599618 RepID=UPI0011B3FB39|nr:NADPH:quinone oxidoreductase family protein [Planomicrobium sp. CPCC 101079]TWT16145.1 NADPH:quinone oxidoreductase family protein [Planomicrobium sp. CPCC 101079]